MKTTLRNTWARPLVVGIVVALSAGAWAANYDLSKVNGIEAFGGSVAAKVLLEKNGFAVADPSFKQIFEAYIESPRTEKPSENKPEGESLPAFITTDSAWHTYHVLLEEGVNQMEEAQSRRLLGFSRRLLAAAARQEGGSALATFASVGLALQDESYRQSLRGDDRRIVDGLRGGSASVAVPVGFDLSPVQFRAQSFYSQSPELSDYFAARQWYASVVFRLENPRETRLAAALAELVNGDADLLKSWQQLSAPYDALLAPAEDGTVPAYASAVAAVTGTHAADSGMNDAQVGEIQKRLEARLLSPSINDQLLAPDQYVQFGTHTRGFRLLPPRRLPFAVCFQNTTDPRIPGRIFPSGLDFLAASAVLRSPAAVRAAQSEFGKDLSARIAEADGGAMPRSLYGQVMQLLATLQKPLPVQAPPCMRNDAWSDLQLWTQLGAWAEQRHTWALHTKMNAGVLGIISPPAGIVAPYPDFFAGLAKLARQTADAFEGTGQDEPFAVKTVAGELVDLIKLSKEPMRGRNEKEFEGISARLQQFEDFQNRYYEAHSAELEAPGVRTPPDRRRQYDRMEKELEDLAQRCAASGQATEAETNTLRLFFDCRESVVRLLHDFAPVCERLAALAAKSLNGESLTEDDGRWIRNYGVTLAGFHFYYGNSYEVPRDDFPIITRIFSSPLADSMLYAGLARTQALYVIVPAGKSLQLHRGAVLTYREFVKPNTQMLDDDSWRHLVGQGQTPPPPPFTRSFYAETSVGELLQRAALQTQNEDADYHDLEEIFWEIGSRATEKDLPALLRAMGNAEMDPAGNLVDNIAVIIGGLPWQSQQEPIVRLLASPNDTLAQAAASIILRQPALLDTSLLTTGFHQQPPQTRRICCSLLSQVPHPNPATRQLFLEALHDPADAVRWQAVLAIEKIGQGDPSCRQALLNALDDTNRFIVAAAAYSLGQLGVTNAAPVLLAKLRTVLLSACPPAQTLEAQVAEITRDFRGDRSYLPQNVLDADHLEALLYVSPRGTGNVKPVSARRQPPGPVQHPVAGCDLAAALIEALGDLQYTPAMDDLARLSGTEYDDAATRALDKMPRNELVEKLLANAHDKPLDSYLREKALLTMCNLSLTNRVRDLRPLLDDPTPIVYSPPLTLGPPWRICDSAAEAMAILLGWQNDPMSVIINPGQRDELMARVREWARQTPP